ncbi:MAG: DUF4010 domain-containing protein [Gemmatimonadales bacterium]|nr:DUF4010 domain-containing protein [Gemmatimonadales bacterium]
MNDQLELVSRLAIAALVGLAVGIERERSGHATGPAARFAGIRTFLLLGLLGGAGGALAASGYLAASAVILAAGAALAVAAYVVAVRRGITPDDAHPLLDGTTETAALVVLALGALAGLGSLRIAAGAGAVVVFALSEKTRIQALVRRFGEREFAAALQFAVLALVVLPLLPAGPIDALWGLEPRSLWSVALLISGLNFVAYVARRLVGRSRGALVAGLLGGLLSSTLTTFTFARQSRREPALAASLGLGALAASVLMPLRVLLIATVLEPRLTVELAPYAVPAALAGGAVLWLAWRRRRDEGAGVDAPEAGSPLRLASAMRLALLFQAGYWLMGYVRSRFGSGSVLLAAALIGMLDMEALTPAMARLAGMPGGPFLAALAIAVGIASDTLLKSALVLGMGDTRFRRIVLPGLLAMLAALVLVMLQRRVFGVP